MTICNKEQKNNIKKYYIRSNVMYYSFNWKWNLIYFGKIEQYLI